MQVQNICNELQLLQWVPFWLKSPEIMFIWAFPVFFQCAVVKLQFVTSLKSARFLTYMSAIKDAANAVQLVNKTARSYLCIIGTSQLET